MTAEEEKELLENLLEAIDGVYESAPSGEGFSLHFAALAALNVIKGMTPGDAVTQAIGDHGTYGVQRKYATIPRPLHNDLIQVLRGNTVCLTYNNIKDRDECVRALQWKVNPPEHGQSSS